MILLFCGLSGAGKSTLAEKVRHKLASEDIFIEIIDADEYRRRLFKDLKYSMEDRFENIRRLGFIASKFSSHNIITIISAINPYDSIRKELARTYKKQKEKTSKQKNTKDNTKNRAKKPEKKNRTKHRCRLTCISTRIK